MTEKLHECEILQKSDVSISIEKFKDGKWYWVFWYKKKSQAHGIEYCPYCGEKLE